MPNWGLREKGLALFAAVSLYVIAATGFLTWQGQPSAVAAAVLTLAGVCVAVWVGRFVAALARLALDLRASEIELLHAREEHFHNERMMLLGGIAAGMSHEIGNAVAGMSAIAAEIHAARCEQRPAQCDTLHLVAHAERLAGLSRRLAVIAGTRSKDCAPVSLNAVLEVVAALFALDQRFRHVEIVQDLDRSLPSLSASEDELVQLALHLLTNAADSFEAPARRAPRIRVATSCEDRWIVLSIADNGCGMDAATAARAMEPFFTTKPAGRGSGLGLDACRRIVERYGGDISLASSVGVGTTARCRFRRVPVPSVAPCDRFSPRGPP